MSFGRSRIRIVAAFVASCIAVAAAQTLVRGAESADRLGDNHIVDKQIVGQSAGGRPIYCEVYGDGPDVLMVIATIHGNEAAGTPLVAAFAKWLAAHPEELAGHTVVIIPVANPDGMATNKRFNAHEVDLNRNFPAGNWGVPQLAKGKTSPRGDTFARGDTFKPGHSPLSEPESRILLQLICRHFPNRILSIHQPVACIDYDGPADKLAAAMAAKCAPSRSAN